MEALQIQTRLCAEGSYRRHGAEAKQRWRYDYLVQSLLVWKVGKMEAKMFFIKPDVAEEQIRF